MKIELKIKLILQRTQKSIKVLRMIRIFASMKYVFMKKYKTIAVEGDSTNMEMEKSKKYSEYFIKNLKMAIEELLKLKYCIRL